MHILLTNDDGIESTGLGVLSDALTDLGEVTVVAPAEDQSAVGRTLSNHVTVAEHERGYAVDGTPTDCVVAGLGSLCPDVDLVVSGCNQGANLGEYVLGRSGTISAAVEATFFSIPAIAVSLYIPGGDIEFREYATSEAEYREAIRATTHLAEGALDDGIFEHADYLNVNAPIPERTTEEPVPMEVTYPSAVYEMTAVREERELTLKDRIWQQMEAGEISDPDGSDRRAILEGKVSVSPLTAPHTTERHEALDSLAERYR
ncbi:MAG TPA: 5'/3'-nucleotidase SurE [Halococcus sp.]|nr:5'/3'-nucleotidase SurE [Halococcus sp.]